MRLSDVLLRHYLKTKFKKVKIKVQGYVKLNGESEEEKQFYDNP
jgi:hypothetical protein